MGRFFEPFLFEELPAKDVSAQQAYLTEVTETIVNAVVHRDYLSTGSVQVMLFKDRLEVWNPGRLPKGMTVEKLNGEHASLPVNPLLANPVYLAGYIEQVGTGTNDVIDRCVELGLRKPEFRQDEDFMVTLWRRTETEIDQSDSESKEKSKEKSKENTLDKVYRLISENPKITTVELAELCGVGENSIYKTVRKLRESGRIVRKGGDKGGEWEIIG